MNALLCGALGRLLPAGKLRSAGPGFALVGLLAWTAAAADVSPAVGPDLVRNGSFEVVGSDGAPAHWSTAGDRGVHQTLTLATGRTTGRCAKLECTAFAAGSPASHAMVCQIGVVGATRGQWYCFRAWVKGTGIARSRVEVGLSNMRTWGETGLLGSFPVQPSWQPVEVVFQATADVPADASRLQIWFGSTGVLWLDDVSFTAVDIHTRYLPEIAATDARNLIPNSSFECGVSGWGTTSPQLRTWTGNIFRLLGDLDEAQARHGRYSFRLQLRRGEAPVYHFDYFDALRQETLVLVTGQRGWTPVTPGAPYVLSADVRAERPGTPVLLFAREGQGREHRQLVLAQTDWQRVSFSFTPTGEALWPGVGLDLSSGPLDDATLWLDALQLEAGNAPSAYAPRAETESAIETVPANGITTDPAAGLTVVVRAWNGSAQSRPVDGRVVVTDYLEQTVGTAAVRLDVAAGQSASTRLEGLARGRYGGFRVRWEPADPGQAFPLVLRAAVIPRYTQADSPFGMNHAYPWEDLLRSGRDAGLLWMRDWSVKWQAVEPEPSRFDFTATDPQVERVLREKLSVLMLFPFPSAPWSSAGDAAALKAKAAGDSYLERRYLVACPPRDDALLARYLSRSVEHYQPRVRCYEILNEPLYTSYAVPREFGYTMADYLRLLHGASVAVKQAQPDAFVVGGMGAWAEAKDVRDFILGDGLRWVDAMDIHLYPDAGPPEEYEADLVATRTLMRERGQERPLWLTEFGCYADDFPARSPNLIGDAVMNRCNWPSERAAAEALVRSAAVFLGNGVQKIFFHAGTCGALNEDSAAGIFFDYGGTPRLMYPALAVLATELGPAPKVAGPAVATPALRAYLFLTPHGVSALAWAGTGPARLPLEPGMSVLDLMGNPCPAGPVDLGGSPVYIRVPLDRLDALRATLQSAQAPP